MQGAGWAINALQVYGSMSQLVEALVQRRCYKSKIKDEPLWIKNCNQTENGSQRRRSEAPRAEIQLNPATQSQTQTRRSKKHEREGAYMDGKWSAPIGTTNSSGMYTGWMEQTFWRINQTRWEEIKKEKKKDIDRNSSVTAGAAKAHQHNITSFQQRLRGHISPAWSNKTCKIKSAKEPEKNAV